VTIGILYGISVGPGDPEMITIKGLKLLQSSEVVAYPAGKENCLGIAEKIIQPWLTGNQQLLPLHFPYVQDEDILLDAWKEAATIIWSYLSQGLNVAFACEGDVNFYGTFSYLAQTIRQLYPLTIVQAIPGVISPIASAASLGIALTQRQQRLLIIPVLYHLDELEKAFKVAEIIVLMKVSSVYQKVWPLLQAYKLLRNSYVVERASWNEEKIYKNLEEHKNIELSYFSLLIIQINRL
jgi:precorrin-2/cobalt-factor-2 C20-methyltransferase